MHRNVGRWQIREAFQSVVILCHIPEAQLQLHRQSMKLFISCFLRFLIISYSIANTYRMRSNNSQVVQRLVEDTDVTNHNNSNDNNNINNVG